MKNQKRIYLDYAAAAPLRPNVLETMLPFLKNKFGNPSSIHFEGREAGQHLENARKKIKKIFDAKNEDKIIFTNGGTESINLAILGAGRANKNSFKSPKIIISEIEHPAVLNAAEQLKKEGFKIKKIKVDEYGIVDLKELEKEIDQNTILISIMQANNEIGSIQPLRKIRKILDKKSFFKNQRRFPIFHTDSCQAANYLDFRPKITGADMITINGSKIGGPKASGLLFIKSKIKIDPIIFGGGQENDLRSGTENVAAWIGLAKALETTEKEKKSEAIRLTKLRDKLTKSVLKEIPRSSLNGHPKKRLPNNCNFLFSGIEGEALILWLDKEGIACSTGSACHSKSLKPSHVLTAIGLKPEEIHGSLRITLGRLTTEKEIAISVKKIKKCVEYLRKISPLYESKK